VSFFILSGDELCELLSDLFEAVAHLLPIVSWLLSQALFTESLQGELPLPPSLVERLVSRVSVWALFTESSCRVQFLAPPHFFGVLKAPCPLCCMYFSVPCLLLFLFYYFFCGAVVSLSRGLCGFIPGMTVEVLHAAYLLTCWSASPKQVWSQCLVAQEPFCLFSVMWLGEALYGLGVCGVRVLLILSDSFLPSVSPVSQQDF
jgi:hypothetical protein